MAPCVASASHVGSSFAPKQGWRGLYAGLTPAVVGGTAAWALYFACYAAAKARLSAEAPADAQLRPAQHLLAAAQAGAVVSVLTNPLWVAKTRLQLQRRELAASTSTAPALRPYTSLLDALRRTAAEEGLRGLYSGLGPSLLLVGHGALQFASYEALRSRAHAHRAATTSVQPHTVQLSGLEYGALGVASKLIASACTYPSQVLRSRLQQRGADAPTGMAAATRQLLASDGLRGLYKGWVPNVLRVLPSSALTFLVYERVHHALSAAMRATRHGDEL